MKMQSIIQRSVIILLLSILSFSGFSEPKDFFPEVEGWQVEVGENVYTPETLWDLINGSADAYLSYDFRKLYTAEYKNNEGHTIKVYAFKHGSPTNAFGIYSQERNTDYEFLDIGSQGFSSAGALYFIKGQFYMQLSTNDKPVYDKLEPLARTIESSIKGRTELPEPLSILPEEEKVKNSEKYIKSDFLGYSFLHSAFIADYQTNDKSFQVFIMAPGNEEETNNILNALLDHLEYPKNERNKQTFRVEDRYIGKMLLYKKGKYLCGIKNADETTGQEYLEILKEKVH